MIAKTDCHALAKLTETNKTSMSMSVGEHFGSKCSHRRKPDVERDSRESTLILWPGHLSKFTVTVIRNRRLSMDSLLKG